MGAAALVLSLLVYRVNLTTHNASIRTKIRVCRQRSPIRLSFLALSLRLALIAPSPVLQLDYKPYVVLLDPTFRALFPLLHGVICFPFHLRLHVYTFRSISLFCPCPSHFRNPIAVGTPQVHTRSRPHTVVSSITAF